MGKFIDVDENCIRNLIMSGLNSAEICKNLHISRSVLFKRMKVIGISFKDYKYFNINIFDQIDTEEKAYWLGFLYADGYVCGYHYQVELSLSSIDMDHLIKFKYFLNDVRDNSVIKTSKVKNRYSRARYIIGDRHFHEKLVELGCVPNKSLILKFPDKTIFSSENLIFDFIRGYIDGDGCLYSNKGRLAIDITGTDQFLEGIRGYFPEFSTPKKDSRSNCYRITCSHRNADIISKRLYENSSIYLTRKYLKFAELCRNI